MSRYVPTFPPLVKPPHWEYFLAIEEDLLRTSRYVEFSEDNFHVHSIEFVRLLLASSSEIDVIAKEFCRLLSPEGKCEDMNDYQEIICKFYPKFFTFELNIPRFNLSLTPWQDWGENKKLPWWQAYNAVKHERSKNYEQATLGNVLDSVAGLFSLSVYYYREIPHSSMTLNPPPKMFSSASFSSVDVHTQIWAYDLPDKHLHKEMR